MDGAVVRGAVDVDTTNVEVVGGAKEELVAGRGGKASPHCSGRGSTGGLDFFGAEGSQDVTVVSCTALSALSAAAAARRARRLKREGEGLGLGPGRG